ncbi:MAG: hypothetical protein GC154_01125 [bacterium]|nr:hypothetical protein [bacterium]
MTIQAQEPLGIFDDHVDVGDPGVPGLAEFDNGSYLVDAVGAEIGRQTFTDSFHFVYKEMTGSFAIEADPFSIEAVGQGGLMIRQSLDPDSPHASYLRTSDTIPGSNTNAAAGSMFPRARSVKGGATIYDGDTEGGFTDDNIGLVRLERIGNSIHFYTRDINDQWVYRQTEVIPMTDPVLVGLAATAQNNDGLGQFEFNEVKIEELPLYVERTLPTDTFSADSTLTGVTVKASVRSGSTADAVITERIRGGIISNASVTGGELSTNADGSLTWTLNGMSGDATLTYDVSVGDGPTVIWKGVFNDGVNRESYIGGDTILPKTPSIATTPSTVQVDPVLPTVFYANSGVPSEGSEDSFGLLVDPRSDNGVAVMAVRGGASNSLEYTLNVSKAGTYYLFGNVRGEDGNSDSWHFGIDDYPAGDDSSRWNINSGKNFAREWVESENPNLDPRPFDLSAGEHTVHLAIREDSASIEWLAIVGTSSLNLGSYVFGSRALSTRSIADSLLDPGENSTTVTVTGYVASGVSAKSTVTENPPAGFDVSGITTSAGQANLNADGSITWDMTGQTGAEQTLTYTLTKQDGVTGIHTFSGSITVGADPTILTGGEASLGVVGQTLNKTVYLFRRISDTGLSDQLLNTDIQATFGVTIVVFDDTNSAGFEMPADLTGADAAIISETVGSGNIAGMNYHVNSPVPQLSFEQAVGDDYLFQTGIGNGTSDGDSIEIVDNTHPITQGFDKGVLKVSTSVFGMGYMDNPPDGVRVLATDPGNPSRARLWVIEKGATVNGNVVPGIRVMSFSQNNFNTLNSAGLQLTNQAIAYVLGVEPPASVDDFMLY